MRITASLILALSLAVAFAAPSAAAAAGGGSSTSNPAKAAPNQDFLQAERLVEAGDYRQAIELLTQVLSKQPDNADAYSLIGFSNRKLGDWDSALTYYTKALALEPDHLGANEYLGELFLEMDDLPKAEERLKVLDRACFFGCEEYRELKAAIAAYRAAQSS